MRSTSARSASRARDRLVAERAVDRAARLAGDLRDRRLVTVRAILPGDLDPLPGLAASARDHRVFWQNGEHRIAGTGAAAIVRARGSDRIGLASEAWRALNANAIVDGDTPGAVLVGGFSFADDSAWQDFPPLRAVVPRVLVESRDGRATISVSVLSGPGAAAQIRAARQDLRRLFDAGPVLQAPTLTIRRLAGVPGDAAWLRSVAHAARDVREKRIVKVVLAREALLRASRAIDPAGVVHALRTAHPDARVFWIGTPRASFLGATPEWLVRVHGREVRTTALAGSVAAGAPGRALLASAKDRTEHAVVTDAIVAQLRAISDRVLVPSQPTVSSIGYIQHLRTPIAARLRARLGALGVAARLHPTPAVAGAPRDAALRIIRAREGFDRGWYAGGVGWVDATGDGEFAVAIRSALVRGRNARVFAGAGIVAASQPEAELAETEAKLAPMLRALGA